MINKKEITTILISVLVIAFSLSFLDIKGLFLKSLLLVFFVISINITAKKITSFYLDSEIEIKPWEIKRYGLRAHHELKHPIAIGMILPILTRAITYPIQNLTWMSSFVFDVRAKVYRAARRYGLYTFSEMTEYHIGLIAASGIIINLFAATIGYLIGFPEFSRLSIYFAFFNMLPISNLDGNKIFFGSIILWTFLASITLIAMFYALFLI